MDARTAAHAGAVRAWTGASRAAAGALVATSRCIAPALAIAWLCGIELTTRTSLGLLIALGALPAAAAALLARAFQAEATLGADELVVARDGTRVVVPRASIAAVRPWRIPLPGAGVAVQLASGARLPFGLEGASTALVAALGAPVAHPLLAWADARRDAPLRAARAWLLRFGVFGLVPTTVLFASYQMIAFGGWRGQWLLVGPRAWLTSLAASWIGTIVGLVLYAGLVRALAEAVALAAAWIAPHRAHAVRRAVEWAVALVYYAGIPALLAIRFLA